LNINPNEYVNLSSNDRKNKIEEEIDNLVCPSATTIKPLEKATIKLKILKVNTEITKKIYILESLDQNFFKFKRRFDSLMKVHSWDNKTAISYFEYCFSPDLHDKLMEYETIEEAFQALATLKYNETIYYTFCTYLNTIQLRNYSLVSEYEHAITETLNRMQIFRPLNAVNYEERITQAFFCGIPDKLKVEFSMHNSMDTKGNIESLKRAGAQILSNLTKRISIQPKQINSTSSNYAITTDRIKINEINTANITKLQHMITKNVFS
ncbi:hypothetical protein M153_16000013370, partial [Pseudoloma neurophilia]